MIIGCSLWCHWFWAITIIYKSVWLLFQLIFYRVWAMKMPSTRTKHTQHNDTKQINNLNQFIKNFIYSIRILVLLSLSLSLLFSVYVCIGVAISVARRCQLINLIFFLWFEIVVERTATVFSTRTYPNGDPFRFVYLLWCNSHVQLTMTSCHLALLLIL